MKKKHHEKPYHFWETKKNDKQFFFDNYILAYTFQRTSSEFSLISDFLAESLDVNKN